MPKMFIVHAPGYWSMMNPGHIAVEADSKDDAIQKVFDTLAPGRGLDVSKITVEEREPGWFELLLGNVTWITTAEALNKMEDEQ